MRVIAKKRLREFWEQHPEARGPILAWFREVERENWGRPAAVKTKYRNASILGGDRVVFNVKGTYRLVVRIKYAYRIVHVRFVGTHAEYDAVDANEV